MALQSSGAISISQINTEKGLTSTTANSSLTTLSTTNINTGSASRPNQSAPHSMSEFYGYNHNPVPTINSGSRSTIITPDCGVYWQVNVSWNTSNANDASYKIVIYDDANTPYEDNLTTASSSVNVTLAVTGDGSLQTYQAFFTPVIKVVRKSDGNIMSSLSLSAISTYYGEPC